MGDCPVFVKVLLFVELDAAEAVSVAVVKPYSDPLEFLKFP